MKTIVIPSSLSSAEDIQEAVDSLRDVARQSRGDITRQSLPESVRPLFDAGYFSDTASLRSTIDGLETAIKSAPRVGLTLAGPIDPSHKAELTSWFRANLSADVIVGYSHNRSLLGGILVRVGSHIYDWSYRSRLLDTDVSFTEVLKNVR